MALRTLCALTLCASVTASATLRGADWKGALEQALETSVYVKSDTAALDGNRITREGTELVVKKSGILASPARHLGSVNTKVRDGAVIQPGGFSALFSSRDITQFNVGDVVYLRDVDVRDDVVVLEVVSREIVPTLRRGTTEQMRYKGEVEFYFPKGYLRTATANDLKRTFDEFFEVQSAGGGS